MKHIDAWLYIGIAVCTALTNHFTTEAAAKFIDAEFLFYFTGYMSALNAGLLAAKMWRSTGYADSQAKAEVADKTL